MLNVKDGAIVILRNGAEHVGYNGDIYGGHGNKVCYNSIHLYNDKGIWPVKDKFFRQFDIANLKELIDNGQIYISERESV